MTELVSDPVVQRNFEELSRMIGEVRQFLDFGDGAPAHSPSTRKLYVRRDGGVGSTFYVYDGTNWTAVA